LENRRFLLLLGIVQLTCGIGILFTTLYFVNARCEISDDLSYCDSIIRSIADFSSGYTIFYTLMIFAPTAAGITEIIVSRRQSETFSWSRYFAIVPFPFIIGAALALALLGPMYNLSYLTKCQTDDCSSIIAYYDLKQYQSITKISLYSIGLISTLIYVSRISGRVNQILFGKEK